MNKENMKKKTKDLKTELVEYGKETASDIGDFAWKHPTIFGATVGVWLVYLIWIFYAYVIHRGEVIDKVIWKKWKDMF